MVSDKQIAELVREMHGICARYLTEIGEPVPILQAMIELQSAARRVVFMSNENGGSLKQAISDLEAIVGRPAKEAHI